MTRFSCTTIAALLSAAILLPASPALSSERTAPPRLVLEVEGGALWQTKNDQQIPNTADATRFSLVDLVGQGPEPFYRVYLTWHLNEKHSLRGLFAPLEFTEPGTPDVPLRFAGADFVAGEEAQATYRFDSYRLTYAYLIHQSESWSWRLGLTAKIRNARVQLVQGETSAKKDDVGFVPLLHLRARHELGDRWYLDLDLDALAGGPGRAIDGALKVGVRLSPDLRLAAGYRTVEGGADVDEVYNFAWLHYGLMSLSVDF